MFPGLCFLASALFLSSAFAQGSYTVWSSVVVLRAGDHTPLVLGDAPTVLTSLGAQQLFAVGQFFRSRYISDGTGNTTAIAPLAGLNAYAIDNDQTFVLALDEQYTSASAQAFMQGFYPPSALNNSLGSMLQTSNILSNGSYIENPLSGTQYPQYHMADALDPDYIFVGGDLDCPALNQYTENYYTSPQYKNLAASSQPLYSALGQFLNNVIDESDWNFSNAWSIYDYISYLATHNMTSASLLNSSAYFNSSTGLSYLDELRFLADAQQYAYIGNLSAVNPYGTSSEDGASSSISTIAGSTLAAKILTQVANNIESGGDDFKLSVLVGDYDPLVSFFALAALPDTDSDFYGLPQPGSALTFEVFSYTNSSSSSSSGGLFDTLALPPQDDLWVRFYFRNGTDPVTPTGIGMQSYSLFNRGPSQTDIMYNDFVTLMTGISIADTGDWCQQCGAGNIFCAAWNSTDSVLGSGSSSSSSHGKSHALSPAAAGAVGAVVALVIAGLVAGLLALLGGVRVHRIQRGRRSEMGGFKGSQKLASDADLALPSGQKTKSGAVVGASVEKRGSDAADGVGPAHPRERVGSWELKSSADNKDVEAGRFGSLEERTAHSGARNEGSGNAEGVRRPSFGLNEDAVNPFQDPVKPSERV